MPPEVSIIMPFYNRAALISATLDSILNQTFRNFELICVDDGSTDNVPQILQTYAKKDSRVKVIRQALTNAGDARNNGYRHSVGKYVFFLDSDDLFASDFIATMVETIKKEQSDVVICQHQPFDHLTGELLPITHFPNFTFTGTTLTIDATAFRPYIFKITPPLIWNKIYRRDIIDQYQIKYQSFPDASEEKFFLFYYLCKCQKITLLNKILVKYRTNNQASLSRVPVHKHSLIALDYLRQRLTNAEFALLKKYYYEQYFNVALWMMHIDDQDFARVTFQHARQVLLDGQAFSLYQPQPPHKQKFRACLENDDFETFYQFVHQT